MSDSLSAQPSERDPFHFSATDDFYRRLVQEGADVLVLVDRSGRLLWANESAARTLARPLPECVDINFVQIVHPEDRERTQMALVRWFQAESDRPAPFENRIVNAEGRVYALRWNIRRHRSEAG